MPAGSFVGALSVTQLADRLGRKNTVILAGIFWVIGSILQCASVVCARFYPFVVKESILIISSRPN
jgi:MFS family permease